jgi:ATP-dependent helicase/nuclease subunit B
LKIKFLCAFVPFRVNPDVHARFLLGPAGSGKTFRCLAEIRAALTAAPEGPPLILLAPKQATFQLERQLLADASLPGYTRLQIFSFERLAQFVLDQLAVAPPKFLSDDGRVMVLHALLLRHAGDLKLFRGSARRPGFAQELGSLLNELQQHQITPGKLRALARREGLPRELRDKLHDLALLLDAYATWLKGHDLQDGNHLLEAATAALREQFKIKNSKLKIEGLWLDGFAEMTPQELDLLAAAIPACDHATLAFCLDDSVAAGGENSWLSIWSAVGKSFQQCRQRLEILPDCEIQVESQKRDPVKNRFAASPALQKLERCWQSSAGVPPAKPNGGETAAPHSIRIVACPDAEAEAAFAVREILRFTRAGGRFRDCAVLVRNLDPYHKPLERALHRCAIPFFLDRRESVAHHPLAELTRNALRTVAFDWQPDDWFAALKAGFSPVVETEIDRLENAALEFGWRGKKWREPLPDEASEHLRKIILPPFDKLYTQLHQNKSQPSGTQLADALRKLWSELKVERTLERWTRDEEQPATGNRQPAIHPTVWDQMNAWLENLALAFSTERLALRDWLPVLEAGLANLTVGVVPPALDQVLVGAIDRARNPDLKLALVLGVNETVFPATPAAQTILTDADRGELPVALGPDLRERLARERYYGYIACTRSSEKLIVTYSLQDAEGKALNPSPFIAQLRQISPGMEMETFSSEVRLDDVGHVSELAPLIYGVRNPQELLQIAPVAALHENLAALQEPDETETLPDTVTKKLYGPVLRTSVSRLEEFAQCPFKFFIRVGLRAGERKAFELDARERGNFQHDVLKIFHEQLSAEGKRWRDLEPAAARGRIAKIAAAQMEHFRDGLFRDSAATVFAARALAESLQDFVEIIVGWMRGQYEFDPAAAELGFGGKDDDAPAWEIDLGNGLRLALQGRIDRVDLWRDEENNSAFAVVMDYKSGGKELKKILVENGVQLQLLAYLGALRHWKNPREISGCDKIIPAGAFYVNLRGEFKSGGSRAEMLADAGKSRCEAYRHTGRFDAGVLDQLDRVHAKDQFSYQLKKDGSLYANSTEALPRAEFEKLLDGVETQLRVMGERIFSGAAQVDPYRLGRKTPCEYCDYQPACRIDKWTHPFRPLCATSNPGE